MPAQPETMGLRTVDRGTFDSFLRTLDEDSNKKISSSCVVYERNGCPHQDKMVPLCGACDSAMADQGNMIKQLEQKGFKIFSSTLIPYDPPVSLVSELQRKADGRTVSIEHHNSKIILKNMR